MSRQPTWSWSSLKLSQLLLAQRIQSWQSQGKILIGGANPSLWTGATQTAGAAGGRTFIAPGFGIAQDGLITGISVSIHSGFAGGYIIFRVFRYNAGTTLYDYIAESENLNMGSGIGRVDVTLATPITAMMGDTPGFLIPTATGSIHWGPTVLTRSRWAAGNIKTSDAFANSQGSSQELAVWGHRPYLALTGDSFVEGHNGAVNWHGKMHNVLITVVPGGEPTSELGSRIRSKVSGGGILNYQNLGLGSQTFAWVVSTGMPAALAVDPHLILVHCGVNDVSAGRTWASVSSDLESIKSQLGGQRLLIDEILPWTAGTDAQALTIRTWNANLAAWCAANQAILVKCHDQMGQIRPSTGELDDLKAAYNQDGIHLTTAGVDALAAVIVPYIA